MKTGGYGADLDSWRSEVLAVVEVDKQLPKGFVYSEPWHQTGAPESRGSES